MYIKLNHEKIQINQWRSKDVVDFSPRASVPGGSVVHSQLGLYQPVYQTNWIHGIGFQWYEDEAGYLDSEGAIDTRHDGIVMLMTAPVESDTADAQKDGFVAFNGAIYAWGVGGGGISGLRKYSSGSWSDVANASASDYGTVNFCIATGTYLFVFPDGARVEKIDTSGTVTAAGGGAGADDYKWAEVHSGYIYAGKDGVNQVYFDSNDDLSDLWGDPSDDTAEIYVGMNGIQTLGSLSWAGSLMVTKPDGLYKLNDDNQSAERVLRYNYSTSNFRFLADYAGNLIFPIKDRLKAWNGRNVNDITPQPISITFPYVTYGQFDNAVVIDDWLVMSARTNESTYEEHILAWDGVGWHKLAEPVTDGASSISAIGYDPVNNYLWYHVVGTSDKTYYIPLQNQSSFPYAAFPTGTGNAIISSRIAAGFRWVKKSQPIMVVETSNCASARYVTLYYQVDGSGTWVKWADIKRDGTTILTNPGGAMTREYDYIQFKFELVTNSAAQTPILEGATMKILLRPDVAYGYTFDIPARSHAIQGGTQDWKTASQIKDIIREARASKSPVKLETPIGETLYGYITSVDETIAEVHPAPDSGQIDAEYNIRVSFVELPELEKVVLNS